MVREYNVTEKQREFLENPARFRAMVGGYGSGKTTAGCLEALRVSLMYKGTRGVICRKTYRELIQTTMDVFWELVPYEVLYRHNRREGEIELRLPNWDESSVIYYMSLDDRRKIEGLNLGWFYIDEAGEVEEEFFVGLMGRLRLKVGPRRGWVTTTPPGRSHWIHKWFVERKHPDFAIIYATTYDNPYLPADYVRMLEEAYGDVERERYLLGRWGAERSGYPIFSDFDEAVHIVSVDEADRVVSEVGVLYRGIDFGYVHPAAVWGCFDEMGRLIIVDEYLGSYETFEVFLRKLRGIDERRYGGRRVRVDFHDPHVIYETDVVRIDRSEIMRRNGFNPQPAYGGGIEFGIELIRGLLTKLVQGKPLLRVSERCVLLIEGFRGGYVWDKDGKKPDKGSVYNHLFDALRYLVVGLERKIVGNFPEFYRRGEDYGFVRRGFTYQEQFKVR